LNHFTPESKQRQIEGARKGGLIGGSCTDKRFTYASKEKQIEGCRKGGQNKNKRFTIESKQRQIEGARRGGKNSHGLDKSPKICYYLGK
jgi:hypothetical protein